MLKWFNKKKKKNNKGFTLVELVIVVAILAILVGLLAPQYTKYVEKSRQSADQDNLEEMVKAFQVVCADEDVKVPAGTYTIKIDKTAKTSIKYKDTSNTDGTVDTAISDSTNKNGAMENILGTEWTSTELKSSNWDGGAIYADITVSADGTVSTNENVVVSTTAETPTVTPTTQP